MLPSLATAELAGHLAAVRRLHEADVARGFGRVVLPFVLDRKVPDAATEWRWRFAFPAGRICRAPRFGPPSRYHLHESVVQKAVAEAARRAGITKRVNPHTMRRVRHPQRRLRDRASGDKPPKSTPPRTSSPPTSCASDW